MRDYRRRMTLLKSVEQNRTWELVSLLAGHRPITLKG